MTHGLTIDCAKNYCNRTLIVKVIVENVVTCFLRHSVDEDNLVGILVLGLVLTKTHNSNHTLDLVITASDTSLFPTLFSSQFSPSDHFPVFAKLSIEQTPLLPNTSFFSSTSFN